MSKVEQKTLEQILEKCVCHLPDEKYCEACYVGIGFQLRQAISSGELNDALAKLGYRKVKEVKLAQVSKHSNFY